MEGQLPGHTITPHSDNPSSAVADQVNQTEHKTEQQTAALDEVEASRLVHSDGSTIHWTASEFIEHQKNGGWYARLAAAVIIAAALIFLVTKDKITTAVVLVAGLALGIFAARKPRTMQYQMDAVGIRVGEKQYGYDMFKSFSVVDEGALASIYLLPLKRFMPPLTIYVAPEDEEKIITMLGDRLPHEERQFDAVDRFMHRIRF